MALTHSCDVIAEALKADKVDAFLYDPAKDTLIALGSSTQPLSMLQRKLGLDLLPVNEAPAFPRTSCRASSSDSRPARSLKASASVSTWPNRLPVPTVATSPSPRCPPEALGSP